MKLLRLELQAFGPYVARQVVDFAQLARGRIFLISGPTGSGKTTLLDAICFALFGETSGGEREAKQMRCQLADPSMRTEVQLEFALGESVYRVVRVPEQERAKRRGTGLTRQRAEAALCRLDGDGREVGALASQWSSTTEQVERLLGVRGDQFRQTVLLPQGQFRRLLLASSRQRQQVLDALFQTELYGQIEEALREEAREIRQQLEQLEQERRLILDQTDARSMEDLAPRPADLNRQVASLEVELKQADSNARTTNERLAEARENSRRFEELESAAGALAELERRREEMGDSEDRLLRGRRAAGLVEVERRLHELTEEEDRANDSLETARSELTRAHRARQQSNRTLERELQREPERDALRHALAQLEQHADSVARLEQTRAELVGQREELDRAEADREQRQQDLVQARGKENEIEDLLGRALALAAEGARWSSTTAEIGHTLGLARKLADSREHLAVARAAHHGAQRELDRLDHELALGREQLDALEQQWHSGQAALLAQRLSDGLECPVCGSTSHPCLASCGDKIPTDATLKRERHTLREVEARRDSARERAAQHKLEDHRLAAEVVTLTETLEQLNPGAEIDQLERELDQAQGRLEAAKAAERRRVELEAELVRFHDVVKQATTSLEASEGRACSSLSRLTELNRVRQEREERIPAGLRAPASLEQVLAQESTALDRLLRRLERCREADRVAGEALAGRQEALRQATERATLWTRRRRAAEQELAHRLEHAGFGSFLAYHESRLEDPALATLEHLVADYREALRAARERHDRAQASCPRQLELPPSTKDLTALGLEAKTAQQKLREISEEYGRLQAQRSQLEDLLRRLQRNEEASAKLEQHHRALGRIAGVATGNNPFRVSFQRYVLASLLDLVLEAASRRLRAMSRGRYDLQRVRAGQGDLRRSGGLDLTVSDSFSGTERPVHTLSGGESFQAALSMALGLADIVQSQSGGIRLETIFIDEGFGSLDPESFELAYRTLVDLEGGQRLVGIISHVPELKEMVDTRLEVVPDRGGSWLKPKPGG